VDGRLLSIDLERMIHQARYSVWPESPLFADGKVMRPPPGGTVPSDAIVGDPALTEGVAGGEYVTRIPVPVTPELLQAGRERFEIFCAPCHGVTGSGDSQVARNMALRKPPDHRAARHRARAGQDQGPSRGYGLMRSTRRTCLPTAGPSSPVRALQQATVMPLASLPDLRARAAEALR
jgi:hypothetical protein